MQAVIIHMNLLWKLCAGAVWRNRIRIVTAARAENRRQRIEQMISLQQTKSNHNCLKNKRK